MGMPLSLSCLDTLFHSKNHITPWGIIQDWNESVARVPRQHRQCAIQGCDFNGCIIQAMERWRSFLGLFQVSDEIKVQCRLLISSSVLGNKIWPWRRAFDFWPDNQVFLLTIWLVGTLHPKRPHINGPYKWAALYMWRLVLDFFLLLLLNLNWDPKRREMRTVLR